MWLAGVMLGIGVLWFVLLLRLVPWLGERVEPRSQPDAEGAELSPGRMVLLALVEGVVSTAAWLMLDFIEAAEVVWTFLVFTVFWLVASFTDQRFRRWWRRRALGTLDAT
ncbi:hypothetical protein B7486_54890 [cyanobacterium TDX16]|nr:hypothetical protein B7486_54890 [cyanobacterium TDX16]